MAAARRGVAPFLSRVFTFAPRPTKERMRSTSPDAEARTKSRSRCVAMRRKNGSVRGVSGRVAGRIYNTGFLLQIFVKHRESLAIPEDVDQTGPGNTALHFENDIRGNFD